MSNVQAFIDNYLVYTGNDKDRVSSTDALDYYNEIYEPTNRTKFGMELTKDERIKIRKIHFNGKPMNGFSGFKSKKQINQEQENQRQSHLNKVEKIKKEIKDMNECIFQAFDNENETDWIELKMKLLTMLK